MTDLTMPRLSDQMQEGTILTWLIDDGQSVAVGEDLLEIETDKATMTYPAQAAGILEIVEPEGASVPVGAVIARVGAPVAGDVTPDTAAPAAVATADAGAAAEVGAPDTATADAGAAPEAGAPADPSAVAGPEPLAALASSSEQPDVSPGPPTRAAVVADTGNGATEPTVLATPLARRVSQLHEIDLTNVTGTGIRGRITREDVLHAASITDTQASSTARRSSSAPQPTSEPAQARSSLGLGRDGVGRITVHELTRSQQVVARRMAEVKSTVPEFQIQTEVVMDAAIALRRSELRGVISEADRMPSFNDLIVRGSAIALRRHPRVNGCYRNDRFELFERVNVGVAVAGEDTLVVPTIFDADSKSLLQIARETHDLAERVRQGAVTPRELSGGTFTVSNLGMFGMTAITPVVNGAQAAILGVGAMRKVLVRVDGEIVDRALMTLTLVCDHRILYGSDASLFLAEIKALLQQPLGLLL